MSPPHCVLSSLYLDYIFISISSLSSLYLRFFLFLNLFIFLILFSSLFPFLSPLSSPLRRWHHDLPQQRPPRNHLLRKWRRMDLIERQPPLVITVEACWREELVWSTQIALILRYNSFSKRFIHKITSLKLMSWIWFGLVVCTIYTKLEMAAPNCCFKTYLG